MLLLLNLAVQLPQSALPAQNRPVLVVHQIEMGAVSNVNARERVYNAVSSAFVKCCAGLNVRRNHTYRRDGLDPVDINLLEKEVNEILSGLFLKGKGPERRNAEALKEFRESITTKYIVIGQLLHNPHSQDRAFELLLHVLDIQTFNYCIPSNSIYLSEDEFLYTDVLQDKVMIYLQESGFCLRYETFPVAPTLENFYRELDVLIRLEFWLPDDQEVRRIIEELESHEKTRLAYLDRRAKVLKEQLIKLLDNDKPRLDITINLLDSLIDTYDQLSELIPSEKKSWLRMKQRLIDMRMELSNLQNNKL